MKYSIFPLLILAMVVGVGCMNENPVATDTASSPPEMIPRVPKMVPFHAHEENAIVCIAPTADCMPGADGMLHAEFPGVIEGDHIGSGTIASTSQVSFVTGIQIGEATVTTPSGDELSYAFSGVFLPGAGGDVTFWGDFTFTGGTGRYATVSGGGTYAGTANTFAGVGQYDLDGMISR